MPLAKLYARPGYNGATILHSRPRCDSMSHVATVFRTMAEGEVWKDRPQDEGFVVTWARGSDLDAAISAMPSGEIEDLLADPVAMQIAAE